MLEALNLLGVSDIINLILTGCGILIFYKIKRWDSKQDRMEADRKKENETLRRKAEEHEQHKINKIKESEEARKRDSKEIHGSIIKLTDLLKTEINERKEEAKQIRKKSDTLDKAILHDALYFDCKRAINNKSVTLYELENIESLFKAYKSVNGNGTIEKMYNKVVKLPVVTADGEQEF